METGCNNKIGLINKAVGARIVEENFAFLFIDWILQPAADPRNIEFYIRGWIFLSFFLPLQNHPKVLSFFFQFNLYNFEN